MEPQLGPTGGLEDASQDPTTARLETFSDGVIAIAITLLILEIKVPHPGPHASLGTALANEWPSYAAYVVSFLTIGVMWVNHHHLFTMIERANRAFLMLNVVWLMTIAFIPWPTALVADHLRGDVDSRRIATLVYGGTMLAIAIMFNVVWRYAARGRRLIDPKATQAAVEAINRSYVAGPTVYTVATLAALLNPWISLIVFAAMAVFWMLPVVVRAPKPATGAGPA